ncbi:MAG: hypothetical protein M1829_001605 [Trizodia sp. TS-e1964]|nr:MAG: hypothetical protein M1829_001605 [Trizodia sp. TS-e1964]
MPDHFLPDSFLALVARDNNKANTSKGLILSINDPVIKSVAQSIVSTLIGAAQASTTPPPTTTTKNTQSQESTSIPASSDSSKPPTSISAPSTAISSSSSGSTNISTSSRISSASSQTASSQTATSSLASAPSDPASDLPTTTRTAPEQGPSQSQAQSQVLTTSAPTTATTMVTLTSTTQAPRQGRACYWPDGSVDTESIPCNPDDTVHSMCCQGGGKAACLDNGLCLWLQDRSVDRNSCTDKGWKDGACMKICMAGWFPNLAFEAPER